jgi:hypothetical protein
MELNITNYTAPCFSWYFSANVDFPRKSADKSQKVNNFAISVIFCTRSHMLQHFLLYSRLQCRGVPCDRFIMYRRAVFYYPPAVVCHSDSKSNADNT